jgi:hypothetical protein
MLQNTVFETRSNEKIQRERITEILYSETLSVFPSKLTTTSSPKIAGQSQTGVVPFVPLVLFVATGATGVVVTGVSIVEGVPVALPTGVTLVLLSLGVVVAVPLPIVF